MSIRGKTKTITDKLKTRKVKTIHENICKETNLSDRSFFVRLLIYEDISIVTFLWYSYFELCYKIFIKLLTKIFRYIVMVPVQK